jgi:nitrogen-specific signal transduction histidine kinase
MKLLALLSNRDDSIVPDVKSALKRYTVYPLKTFEELEDLYSNIPLNLLLIDTTSHKLSSMSDFLNKLDNDRVVLIAPDKLDKYTKDSLPRSIYDSIDAGSIKAELPVIVERVLEKQQFENELRLLKKSKEAISQSQMRVSRRPDTELFSGRCNPDPSGRYIHEKVVVNFAKMLTASFDMQKLFNHFIDSVMEIARVSKMSIMLRDKDVFQIKNHYGLDPSLADNIQLRKDTALASWLARTGRIINKPVNFLGSESVTIKNEMEILQCSVSFPLIHRGKLIGIFNIDNKITEEPFYAEEMEIIYVLCNYLAVAVKDIYLYHSIWYQKEFTNNIISSMSSGMIAIDREEKITIFNQQASGILKISSSDIIGKDLRSLPSPLGDLLYETMVTGKTYKRYEVTINPADMPIGINSYRLHDEQQNPVGAGIVFSDLSDSRKLAEQRRKMEQLKTVNDLMAKIAHEVRNPLTSIQTYVQLLHEKQVNDELQRFYISTVSQSINRLDSLIDKLITFSDTQDYCLNCEDINELMSEAADLISRNIPVTHKFTIQPIDKPFYVNADKRQLVKAIYYLVISIIDKSPDGTSIKMSTSMYMEGPPSAEILITYDSEESIEERKQELLKPFFDIKNLGSELNVPISNKIIEGHGGCLDIKSKEGINTYIIKLPILDRSGTTVSSKGGYISGK